MTSGTWFYEVRPLFGVFLGYTHSRTSYPNTRLTVLVLVSCSPISKVYVNDLDSVADCAIRLGWSQSLGKKMKLIYVLLARSSLRQSAGAMWP